MPIICYTFPMAMTFLTAAEVAERWQVSERSVRNYCALGRVPGAILQGKTWIIPVDASKPQRQRRNSLSRKVPTVLEVLRREREAALRGGLYHKIQIDLTFNSNHIEGSRLTHDQTRYIFETKTVGAVGESLPVDDIVETANHFRCIDLVIDAATSKLTEGFIKQLHLVLKNGTSDSLKTWFRVGGYKLLENEVGGQPTTPPKEVSARMRSLLSSYNAIKVATFDDILNFHVEFEGIHPFQDGNGRIGRLLLFKECLRHGITPFIITEELKYFYYRGLKEWHQQRGYLRDTCLTAQDAMVEVLGQLGLGK